MSDFVMLDVYCYKLVLYCLISRGLILDAVFLQAPSATVVVKGLSQKTNEEDLYQILVLFYLMITTSICKCLLFT